MKALLLLLVTSFHFLFAIPNFQKVNEGIYRGGRPSQKELDQLAKKGFKTILNIDDDVFTIQKEEQVTKNLGLNFISVPLSGFFEPKDRDIAQILNVLNEPRNFPIFIHCHHGEDRTGLVMGLYRVFTDHWTPKDAYKEMLKYHFHPFLFQLKSYFQKKTGYPN